MKYAFPDGFLWGASTSSHQVEGGNTNQWSEWEKKNATRLASEATKKHGTLPSWNDIRKEAKNPQNYISGIACDHYNRFEEDFDIAKSLGHTAHRLSIEWSRVEPREGFFDEKEIAHYQRVIQALRARNIEPFVTLWHWTLPFWVSKQGSWENKKTISDFVRYAKKLAESLPEVRFWVTLNEPLIYTGMSYMVGTWPPQKKSVIAYIRVIHNLITAHKDAYRVMRTSDNHIGIAKHNIAFTGIGAMSARWWFNRYFLEKIKNHQDFIGLNYYQHKNMLFGKNNKKNPTDVGWEIYPEGIYRVLKELAPYKKPVYITENGIADAHDTKRTQFIKDHLIWIHKAIAEGVGVRGYLYWSLLDNFEWSDGFWPRFGLVEVDRQTLERRIRPSAHEYAKIIKNNGF
ncbi:MAG: glycoside hydrolase family 1 protein [bacterium]|nr:glycoside hydrolase family 1 protein [bacterium]